MPDVVCPQCGSMSDLVAIRRAADEFCPACDFPLFWAPAAAVPFDAPSETATGRLPGVGGRQAVGNVLCPSCGELNSLVETNCVRCDAALVAATVEPAPVELEPLPRAPDVVADEPSMSEFEAPDRRADGMEAADAGAPPWNPLSVSLAALSGVLLVALIVVLVV